MTIANNGIPVNIQLKTQITQDGQSEQFEFDEQGTFLQMGQTLYLRYVEHDLEGNETPVTFKITSTEVQLTRQTGQDVRLRFVPGRSVNTRYFTPAGSMAITVATQRIVLNLTNNNLTGQLAIDYVLITNGNPVGDYQIRLSYSV